MLMSVLAAVAIGAAAPPPARVVLVGDSLMAPKSGYGEALCQRFRPGVQCVNRAIGGQSSGSYLAMGHWAAVMAVVRDGKPKAPTFVLIEFGHNDEPGHPGKSTNLQTEFPDNLARYVREVRAAGAVPVLVTPLARRYFRRGILLKELAPWAEATRQVAESEKVAVLDLYSESYTAIDAMGEEAADRLALVPPSTPVPHMGNGLPLDGPAPFDHTHVGARGASFAADIMVDLIKRDVPALAGQLQQR
jgi:lysophospholipase L1-like esterase